MFLYPTCIYHPSGGWLCRNFVKIFDADETRMIGWKIWQYVKPFSSDTGTSRTDRRTDGQICYINIARQCADNIITIILFCWHSEIWCCFLSMPFHSNTFAADSSLPPAQQCLGVSVRQHNNSWIVWDIVVNYSREQDIVISSNDFETGYIPMHCSARVAINVSVYYGILFTV